MLFDVALYFKLPFIERAKRIVWTKINTSEHYVQLLGKIQDVVCCIINISLEILTENLYK